MPTQITQVDDPDRGITILRVEGQVLQEDALVLARIAHDLNEDSGQNIAIDLADVDFIDSEAAPILKELQTADGFELMGMEMLLQNAINEVERHGA
ncbi:MAG TPA: STAS domain-containing protein [Pyrinomonadaceae bacterium]|jgi:anti-anti-sigma regulatory factor|nr:STAS domain-containing protein [Pyrinomonadaceae bacterium]